MAIDVEAVRADTPGCGHVVHLNNAGASLPPASVTETVIDYLRAEAITGGYEIADQRADQLSSVYRSAAALFGGEPQNWAFVESATRAWNAAFTSLRFQRGDRILTSTTEYPSNMAGLLRASELQGAEIIVVPDDDHGQVDVSALESLLDDRTRLVSLTHIPTQSGLVNPAAAVGEILRDTPILFQLDACQSAGQIPVDVDDIGCDVLSFTGRKFLRGPRATGMVWANDAALDQMDNPAGIDSDGLRWDEPMRITPNPTAGRFEPYEVFFAGKVGLSAAIDYAARVGIEQIAERNAVLAGLLRTGLSEVGGVTLADKGELTSALVTFTVDGHDPAAIREQLRQNAINVSTSTAGSARLDFPNRGLEKVVRASVHYFNTETEIDAAVAAIAKLTQA